MSENAKIVLFESRGGRMRCGPFAGFRPDGRIQVLTNPENVVKYTSVKESSKRSPEDLCAAYNVLLDRLQTMEGEIERLRSDKRELKRLYFNEVERAAEVSSEATRGNN